MCACEANRVVLLLRKPGWEADSARYEDRRNAIKTIMERVTEGLRHGDERR